MGLLHIDIFYKYLVEYLLNLKMHLFFLIQNLLLLIFCMDDLEYMVTLSYVLFYFHYGNHHIKIDHLYLLIILLIIHTWTFQIHAWIFECILLWKFQINKNFNKSHLIIHQMFSLKTLWIFTKMYCKTIFIFIYWCYSCLRQSFTF